MLVLQHPRERLHPIGTARFAQLGLCNARVEVAWNAGAAEERAPAGCRRAPRCLYPTPHARDLRALPVSERPRHLLVLDGTWHTARTLYRDKAWLAQLPHVRFTPLSPSNYRLRREPTRDHVSTIEAIVEALRVLEPETRGLDQLLAAFDAMIDAQLAHALRGSGPRRARKRRPPSHRRIPEALVSGLPRMVVVYVESVARRSRRPRELVQVSAERLWRRRLQQWHLRSHGDLPDARVLTHMRLGRSDFAGAVDDARFAEEWARFLSRSRRADRRGLEPEHIRFARHRWCRPARAARAQERVPRPLRRAAREPRRRGRRRGADARRSGRVRGRAAQRIACGRGRTLPSRACRPSRLCAPGAAHAITTALSR